MDDVFSFFIIKSIIPYIRKTEDGAKSENVDVFFFFLICLKFYRKFVTSIIAISIISGKETSNCHFDLLPGRGEAAIQGVSGQMGGKEKDAR